MQHGRRWTAVPVRALLALLVVLTATGCLGESKKLALPPAPSISAAPTDLGIKASGLPDGVELAVTDTSVGVQTGAHLDFVSPVFTVEPSGTLAQPATITVELDNALPAATPVLVATRASADQPWAYQTGRLTEDQRHVEYTTTDLNQLGVLTLNVDAAVESLSTDIRNGLAAGVNKLVKPPTCDGRPEARLSGYSVTSTKSKALHWCFGLQGGKRVVRVTNRLRNPIEVAHPNVPVLKAPLVPGVFSPWGRFLGTTNTFLAPGRTATFDADLQPVTALFVSSDSSAMVQSLRLFQATARAIVLRLVGFGVGPATVGKTVDALLAKPQCRQSLGKGSDALLAGCFSPAKMASLFGSRAVLLAPLLTAPTTATFFRAQAQAMTVAQPEAQQRIDVKRAAPDFTAFVGLWSGKSRLLTISAQGLVTETVYDDAGKLVIQLTYQLTDPVSKAGTTSAPSTITKVKIGQRKLVKGRLPQVGDTGVTRVSQGVVRPPALQTTYCDAKKAKKGVCGK